MDRRKFIENSCLTCVAVALGSSLLQSCSTMKTVNAFEENGFLVVDKSEFGDANSDEKINSIIVASNSLKVPLILFKTGDDSYEAISLKCTHKGVKLNYEDSEFKCPAHGSIFDREGKVVKGPAKQSLTHYKTDKTATTIRIEV